MKARKLIIESCTDCPCLKFFSNEKLGQEIAVCDRLVEPPYIYRIVSVHETRPRQIDVPYWCPLDVEASDEDGVKDSVIIDDVEWMTENLTGHGGVKTSRGWFYTWQEAIDACTEIEGGWRLPDLEEARKLLSYKSSFDCTNQILSFNRGLLFPALCIYLGQDSPNPEEVRKRVPKDIVAGFYWTSGERIDSFVSHSLGVYMWLGKGMPPRLEAIDKNVRMSVRLCRKI